MNQSEKIIFADKNLAQRIERVDGLGNAAFVEARAKLFPESNARWREIGGAFAMFDGVGSPLTQVFALGLFQDVNADVMEEIENFFCNHNAPVFIEACPLADMSLLNLLHERGYKPIELSNVLVKLIDEETATSKLQTEVKARLIGEDEKDAWANALAKGWSEGNKEVAGMFLDISKISLETEGTYCFAATLNDEIIAGGMMNVREDIAGLAGVSTVPEHRRKGAQNALFNFRINFAREHNCDIATVVTLPGSYSQRNAERNGFRVAYTRTKWRWGDGEMGRCGKQYQ
jgi:GNAT superfamily N-acetyltransferase